MKATDIPMRAATVLTVALMLVSCRPEADHADLGTQDSPSPAATSERPPEDAPASPEAPDPEAPDPAAAVAHMPEGVVREIHPDEWGIVLAACVRAAGFAAHTTRDGGVRYPEVPTEQAASLDAVVDRCLAMFPIDEKYKQPLSDEQIRLLYRWNVDNLVPCLEAEGFAGFDPPSEDEFVASYKAGPWTPLDDIHDDVTRLNQGQWERLNQLCPQAPPVDDLYG